MGEPAPQFGPTPPPAPESSSPPPPPAPHLQQVTPPPPRSQRRVRDLVGGLLVGFWALGAIAGLVANTPPPPTDSYSTGQWIGILIGLLCGVVSVRCVMAFAAQRRPSKLVRRGAWGLFGFVLVMVVLAVAIPVYLAARDDGSSTRGEALVPETPIYDVQSLELPEMLDVLLDGWTLEDELTTSVEQVYESEAGGLVGFSATSFRGDAPDTELELVDQLEAYVAEIQSVEEDAEFSDGSIVPVMKGDHPFAVAEFEGRAQGVTFTVLAAISFDASTHRAIALNYWPSDSTDDDAADDELLDLMTAIQVSVFGGGDVEAPELETIPAWKLDQ